MITEGAREFFARLPRSRVPLYRRYWERVTPLTRADELRRWLFAYCSIHTNWQGNVRGYLAVKDWTGDHSDLLARLTASRVGLQNMRARFIMLFRDLFYSQPALFEGEQRDEIAEKAKGLGLAKTSFALNMIRPLESRVICLDVHMLRLYGEENLNYKTKSGVKAYRRIERDWVQRCGDVPPYLAHAIYWDRVHKQVTSRYWSRVLE